METEKHPRTLQEAFGPYTSHHVAEPEGPTDWQDWVVIVASALTLLAVLVSALWGWV